MTKSDSAIRVRAACGTALIVGVLAWPSNAMAQGVPDCAPDKMLDFKLTSQDAVSDAENPPLVATHEVDVTAEFAGYATAISVTPAPGVQVVKQASGSVDLFVPVATALALTVSWRQPAEPSDTYGPRCAASRVVTLPVLAANPSRVELFRAPAAFQRDVSFTIEPARRRPNLAPLEITLRTTGRPRLPSRGAKPRTWAVPMREGEQVKYDKRIPPLTVYLSTAKRCRFYNLSCGPVFSDVDSIQPGGDHLRVLAFTQPARWAAPNGINVDVRPSGQPDQPFGFDVQVRQAGRLLARYRRAGRCRDVRRSTGIFRDCRLTAKSNQPR